MKSNVNRCRFCGQEIAIITWGVYRKIVVDAEPVWVLPDAEGDEFVRIDGSKVKAIEVDFITPEQGAEPAYRLHGRSCDRRPS